MRLVAPITIAPGGALISTNVTGGNPAAYASGTTYGIGDRATVGDYIYESNISGNAGNNPPDNLTGTPPKWSLYGPINALAMFDRRVGSQTVNAGSIVLEIKPGEVVDTVSFRNTEAATITVSQVDPVEGTVFPATVVNMVVPVANGWEYVNLPIERNTDALVTGLKPYRNASIHITISNPGGDAASGLLIVGRSEEPGPAEAGASDWIKDYSPVTEDKWGIKDYEQGDYADDAEFTVKVPKALSPRFRRTLTLQRAKPTLVILADGRPDAQYYGLLSFRRTLSYPDFDFYTVSVRGLT